MTERDHAHDAERLSVAELRDAPRDAGIAPGAFEQALAELRTRGPVAAPVSAPTRLQRLARFWPAALILAALLSIFVLRLFPAT